MRATVGWLEYADTELGSAERVLTYLRRGLAGPSFNVSLRNPVLSEADCGYEDVYADDYETLCPYAPPNLECYCAATSETQYVSPAYDPAPWYDSDRLESGEFLGFQSTLIDIPSNMRRTATARGNDGSSIGRLRKAGRVAQISGYLYATSPAGMAYGEAWLAHQLQGSSIGCAEDRLRLLPACPDDSDTARYFRALINAGLTDGPTFTPAQQVPGCVIEQVTFQLASASELQSDGTTLHDQPVVAGVSELVLVEGPNKVGETAVRLTLYAGTVGSSLRDVVIRLRPTSGGVCPSSETATVSFEVDYVPLGGRLELDSANRTLVIYDSAGDVYGSYGELTWTGVWEWLTVAAGAQACLQIDATSASTNPGSRALVEAVLVES